MAFIDSAPLDARAVRLNFGVTNERQQNLTDADAELAHF